MIFPLTFIYLFFFSLAACESDSTEPAQKTEYTFIKAFDSISFNYAIELINIPNSEDFIVLEQGGKIFRLANQFNTEDKSELVDINTLILTGGEQGLLGLAFDPNFASNSYIYLNYTATSPRRTVIARFNFNTTTNVIDINSKLVILEYNQPYSNHNGGKIAFGADGYLYISAGDGGSAGDPQGYAQNGRSLLGKMIRIDVSQSSLNEPYKIPSDNPFVNDSTVLDEVYALGLRNVWKFSFDAVTGKLWAADVGQYLYEEINQIESGQNYGWNHREGFHPYNGSSADASKFKEPIYEYGRAEGGSITGGYVYRGKFLSQLRGAYIYGDYASGNIWALKESEARYENTLLFNTNGRSIATFGVDSKGEIYFSSFDGQIYKIVEKD